MAHYQIILSPRAQADLKNVRAYTVSTYGDDQTKKYLSLLEDGINQLLDNSEIGRNRDDVKLGYRSLNIEKHIIFYKIKKTDIHILGVIHSRMDVTNQFSS
tara:strand:+ start:631 stop:933 length:303 start_codon:yes stop_codon:yes gene_type:complete